MHLRRSLCDDHHLLGAIAARAESTNATIASGHVSGLGVDGMVPQTWVGGEGVQRKA